MRAGVVSGLSIAVFAALSVFATGAPRADGRVYSSPEAVEPLGAGAQVPAVRVATLDGEFLDLAQVLHSRGALLVFFRGGW